MAKSWSNLIVSLLLSSPSVAAANILPRQTAFSNSTATGTPTTSASSGTTPPPCCWIVAGGTALGLHKWYSSTAEHVVATVITTYIRENNGSAVPANSTTIYVAENQTSTLPHVGQYGAVFGYSWPWVRIPGVPTTLIDNLGWGGGDYAATVVDNNTVATFDFTDLVVAQPTPFDVWFAVGVYTQAPNTSQALPTGLSAWPREACGTWSSTTYNEYIRTTVTVSGSATASYATGDLTTSSQHIPYGKEPNFFAIGKFTGGWDANLNVTYVQTKTSQIADGRPWIPIPTGLKDWLGKQEHVVEQYPYITDCWLDNGNGQPSVHVPVNALTVTSSQIIDVQIAPTETPGKPRTETPTTSIDGPQSSPRTEVPQTSVNGPGTFKTAHTENAQTTLDTPTTKPTDTEETTLGVPRTGDKQPTLDALKTTKTSAAKAHTENANTVINIPEGSPTTAANQPGTAVEVQTPDDDSKPTSDGTDDDSNNDNQPPSSNDNNGQTGNDEHNDNKGSQGTQVQDNAKTAGGAGALISAIQSAVTRQGQVSQDSQNGQKNAPDSPLAVITTAAPGNRPAASVTGFVLGSQTASPGGAPITQGGSTFSALPSGSGLQIIADGQTSTIVNAALPGNAVARESSLGDNAVSSGIEVAHNSDSDDSYAVGGETLTPGGAVVTSGGSTYSALPSGLGVQIVANDKTQIMPGTSPSGFQVAEADGSDIGYVVGQNTLAAGGPATTRDGAVFSALPSGGGILIVSNGQTSTVPVALPAGSSGVQIGDTDEEYIFADNTLIAGGQAVTSDGITFSALPSGSGVLFIADGQTTTLSAASSPGSSRVQTAGARVEYAVAGTMLTAGGQVITSDGATYSALPSGHGVLVVSNGQTSTLSAARPVGPATDQKGIPEGEYLFAGTTLTAGGDALTSAGTTYSALPSGSGIAVIADGTTSTASVGAGVGATTLGGHADLPTPVLLPASPEQLVTIGGSTYTARVTDGSLLVLGSQTLRPGATTVINGETLLLTGSNLVLATGTSTSTHGLGDAIMSGIGGGSEEETGSESSESAGAEPTSGPESSSTEEPTSGAARRSFPDMRIGLSVLGALAFAAIFA